MALERTDYLDESRPPFGKRQVRYTSPNRASLTVIEVVPISPDNYVPLPYKTPHPDYDNNGLVLVWQGPIKAANNQIKVMRVYANEKANEDWYNYAVKYSAEAVAAPIYIREYIRLRENYVAGVKGNPLTGIVGLTVTAPGSGYDSTSTVALTGGGGTGALASIILDGDTVLALELVAEGSGYTSAPTVVFSGPGTGAAATAAIQPPTALLVKEETTKLDTEDPQLASLFHKIHRVYEVLPGPFVATTRLDIDGVVVTVNTRRNLTANITSSETLISGTWTRTTKGEGDSVVADEVVESRVIPGNSVEFTRYDNDLGYVKGERTLVAAANQSEIITAISRIGYASHDGSDLVLLQTEETWTDGVTTPFPTKVTEAYKDAFHEPAKRGATDRREQIIVASGSERATLIRSGSNTIKVSYEPYPPNPFLLLKITETWVTPVVNDERTTSEFGGAVLAVTERTDQPGAQSADTGYLVVASKTETKNPNEQTKITEAAQGIIEPQLELTNGGSGYTSPPTVVFTGGSPPGPPPTATAAVTFSVDHVNVTSGGSGYSNRPAVSFSGDGNGAIGYAVLGFGVAEVQLTNAGSGYTSDPDVQIIGDGSGAVANVVRTYGITSATVTNVGSGYTSDPIVTATGDGVNASFRAVRGLPLLRVNILTGGSGYTSVPTVTIAAPGGGGVTAVGAATLGYTVASITVTNSGSGYSSAPTVQISGGSGNGATAVATLLGYSLASILVTANGSGYTSPPTVTIQGDGNGATGVASLGVTGTPAVVNGGTGGTYAVNDVLTVVGGTLAAVGGVAATLKVTAVSGTQVTAVSVLNPGKYLALPTNPVAVTGGGGTGATFTLAWDVVAVDVTAGGSGYFTAPTIVLSGGGGTGAAASGLLSSGQTIGVTLTNPGVGYETAPTIAFSGGGGTGAAATAVLATTGSVKKIVLSNNGTRYATNPAVTITGGGGTGAAAVGVRNVSAAGIISSITVINPGTGYTSPPTLVISGGGGTGAAATAVLSSGGVIGSIQLTAPGSGFTMPPSVLISGGGGTGAAARAILETAGSVIGVTVTSPGTGYSTAPTVSFFGGDGTGAAATAFLTATGSVSSLDLTSDGGPFTTAPTVSFSGGGGTGAAALYLLVDVSWPQLQELITDPLTGVRINVIKKVVPSIGQPNYIPPPPWPAYVDDKPYDQWRTLRLISAIDPNSLPPPLIYTTSQHVSFPHLLLEVSPIWDQSLSESMSQTPLTVGFSPGNVQQGGSNPGGISESGGTGRTEVTAHVHGVIKVLKQGGFRGGAIARVEETYFIGPPPDNAVPSPTIIRPSSGFAYLRGQSITSGQSGSQIGQPINPITGLPEQPGDIIGYNPDGTPIIAGGYIIPQVPTSSTNDVSTQTTIVDISDVLTAGLDSTETYTASQNTSVPGTENFADGSGNPLTSSATATGVFGVSVPASCPAAITPGMAILAEVYVERQRFNLFLRRIIHVIAPGDCQNTNQIFPIDWWTFEEPASTGFDLGSVRNIQLDVRGTENVTGKVNKGVSLDATTNDELVIDTPTNLLALGSIGIYPTGQFFSMMGWINPLSMAASGQKLNMVWYGSLIPPTPDQIILAWDFHNGNVQFSLENQATDYDTKTVSCPVAGSGWYFFYLEYKNGILGLSINNGSFSYTTIPVIFTPNPDGTFTWGYQNTFGPTVTLMDELVVYGLTLSAADLTAIYNAGAGVTWPFFLSD
jgi:hypothetical protein